MKKQNSSSEVVASKRASENVVASNASANVSTNASNEFRVTANVKANNADHSVEFIIVDDCDEQQARKIARKLALIRAQDKERREANKNNASPPKQVTFFVSALLERAARAKLTSGQKAVKAAAEIKNIAASASADEKAALRKQLEEMLQALG